MISKNRLGKNCQCQSVSVSGFSGGKQEQKIAIARNRGRLCSLQTTENVELFFLKTIKENYGWSFEQNIVICRWRADQELITWYDYVTCYFKMLTSDIIIRCKFFFLFIGREGITWPADNCIQIMVSSCAMSSNVVWLQVIFCSCVNETTLFSLLLSLMRENGKTPDTR